MGPLGVQELIIIFVIALLIFGPKKLPELGKSLGKGLNEFKKATSEMKASWDEQMREVENLKDEATKDIKEAERDLRKEFYESQTAKTSKDSSNGQGAESEPVHSEQATESHADSQQVH